MLTPFRALRPPRELAAKIACPPYDVVNRQEAFAFAADNEQCFFHVSRPEIDLLAECDEHDASVYAKGAENLAKFRANGWLQRDAAPRFYLYRQTMAEHTQVGVVGLSRVADYDNDRIRKHEHTRPDKEDDRTQHIYALNGDDESVFLTYRADAAIDALVNQAITAAPEIDFVAEDGVRHTIWIAAEATTAALAPHFSRQQLLYIADGHHRCAAASRAAKLCASNGGRGGHEYFLATVIPHNQVQILDYNRAVKDLNGLSSEQFLARLAHAFEVTPTQQKKPLQPRQFGLYLESRWYRLTARPESFRSDTLDSLDVSILQENVLRAVLGINDVRTNARVQFIGGIRGVAELERLVDSGQLRAAFAMFPTQLNQLMAVADAGGIMPPKSTWFEPKLRSGLLLHVFGD